MVERENATPSSRVGAYTHRRADTYRSRDRYNIRVHIISKPYDETDKFILARSSYRRYRMHDMAGYCTILIQF